MSKTIIESGMEFIADNTFHIERSPLYTSLGGGVKSVEFIRAIENKLLFIEAKSSFPNPDSLKTIPREGGKTGKELFHEAVKDICDKYTHSLNLYAAIATGVTEDGFPPDYAPGDKVSLLFILVIKGFEKSWCAGVERALTNQMRNSVWMSKIWRPNIVVINEKVAVERGLIAS
jgi:hypothetical protein